jgi:hypothetical protein
VENWGLHDVAPNRLLAVGVVASVGVSLLALARASGERAVADTAEMNSDATALDFLRGLYCESSLPHIRCKRERLTSKFKHVTGNETNLDDLSWYMNIFVQCDLIFLHVGDVIDQCFQHTLTESGKGLMQTN